MDIFVELEGPGTTNQGQAFAPPPLGRVPHRIVVLLGGKLIGLDSILPVMLELKGESSALQVDFLFLNARTLDEIGGNYVLIQAMSGIGAVHTLSNGRAGWLSRARTGLRLLAWLARMGSSRTLLIGYTDYSQFPFNVLAAAARLRGAAVLYAKPAYPESAGFRQAMRERHGDEDQHYGDSGDACVVYHPDQATDLRRIVSSPLLVAGTPRRYPAWQAHLDRVLVDHGIRDLDGERIATGGRPVFVLFYPGNHALPTLARPTSCRDRFRLLLEAVAEEAPGALVLVKPHVICNPAELEAELARFPGLDVRVTEAHPQLLARVATAAATANGSNVMNDMYLEGVPVLEASEYTASIMAAGGTLYPHGLRIGCGTPSQMRAAVRAVLEGWRPESAPDDSGALYWPKPPSLLALLCADRRPADAAPA